MNLAQCGKLRREWITEADRLVFLSTDSVRKADAERAREKAFSHRRRAASRSGSQKPCWRNSGSHRSCAYGRGRGNHHDRRGLPLAFHRSGVSILPAIVQAVGQEITMPHYLTLTTSNGNVTETRVIPGIRGGDRAINHARQLAMAWGLENGSNVVTFTVEDAAGKPVGEGALAIPPGA